MDSDKPRTLDATIPAESESDQPPPSRKPPTKRQPYKPRQCNNCGAPFAPLSAAERQRRYRQRQTKKEKSE